MPTYREAGSQAAGRMWLKKIHPIPSSQTTTTEVRKGTTTQLSREFCAEVVADVESVPQEEERGDPQSMGPRALGRAGGGSILLVPGFRHQCCRCLRDGGGRRGGRFFGRHGHSRPLGRHHPGPRLPHAAASRGRDVVSSPPFPSLLLAAHAGASAAGRREARHPRGENSSKQRRHQSRSSRGMPSTTPPAAGPRSSPPVDASSPLVLHCRLGQQALGHRPYSVRRRAVVLVRMCSRGQFFGPRWACGRR